MSLKATSILNNPRVGSGEDLEYYSLNLSAWIPCRILQQARGQTGALRFWQKKARPLKFKAGA